MDIFTDNWIWILMLGIGVYGLVSTILDDLSSYQVSIIRAVELFNQEQAMFVDIRDSDALAKCGTIKLARHIIDTNLSTHKQEFLASQCPVIVVCHSGRRSSKYVKLLRKEGAKHIYVLQGGVSAWQQAGLPLESVNHQLCKEKNHD